VESGKLKAEAEITNAKLELISVFAFGFQRVTAF
jgi:hypothetical protein